MTRARRYIQRIIHLSKYSELKGHLVFIENYDVHVARQMVSGCDVWLNNPRRPLEASGTSGQKAGCHGCLNLSIMDGWWREGFDGTNGFAIGGDSHPASIEEQDQQDSANLYKALTEQVIPAFYNRDDRGMPRQWLANDPPRHGHAGAAIQHLAHGAGIHPEILFAESELTGRRMDYEAVIGLETHVQLKTKSKMWCGCANEFGAPPNTHVCPVCLGLPGVLPVANEEALRLTALTGLLLNCTLPAYAKFDRKNYFYPDMPKNYQITQYDKPSTVNGYVDFEFNGGVSRVRITRAHLEEDVGKSFHFERNSGVDFNRAGVPLLEIVSEPEITSAAHGLRVSQRAEGNSYLRRRQRRRHGKRHGAMRCQRQRPPARREGVGQKDRDQKHEQLQRRRGGRWSMKSRGKSKFCSRAAKIKPGNPPLGRSGRDYGNDAEQGNGPRLPLFPRAGPDAL